MEFRVGIGIDFHRFTETRRLVLGGVIIPNEPGLAGHSDADVVLHAICDALLGAAALGDLGQHFPPEDPQYQGISSLVLLGRVRELLGKAGYVPFQVDVAVVAERPRLAPFISAMREKIAQTLEIPKENVAVKATTPEKMGALGRAEGIGVWAVALIRKA